MKNVDIINIGGLAKGGNDDALSRVIKDLKPRSFNFIAPTPLTAAYEDPEKSYERAVLQIEESLERVTQEYREPRLLLVGRSYGGFIAAQYIVRNREKLRGLLGVVIIEAPLNSEVEVSPPAGFPLLQLYPKHYKARARLAVEIEQGFQDFDCSAVTIVKGGTEDAIVPLDAQSIDGDFQVITGDVYFENPANYTDQGRIILLPYNLGGSGFPANYSTHILPSEPKLKYIGSIVAAVAQQFS